MNITEELKKQSMSTQEKLTPNVYVELIRGYVGHLRERWKPVTKEVQNDEGETFTLYYDEYNNVWTTQDSAFKGHVFKKVSRIINK